MVNFFMIISSATLGPILQTVSAVAPLKEHWIPSLRAESLYDFLRARSSEIHCSNDISPLAISPLKAESLGVVVLRVPSSVMPEGLRTHHGLNLKRHLVYFSSPAGQQT